MGIETGASSLGNNGTLTCAKAVLEFGTLWIGARNPRSGATVSRISAGMLRITAKTGASISMQETAKIISVTGAMSMEISSTPVIAVLETPSSLSVAGGPSLVSPSTMALSLYLALEAISGSEATAGPSGLWQPGTPLSG